MLSTAIIVFREVFEAALVVGIVMAAVRMVKGHRFYIALGLALGLAGAVLVAVGAERIGSLAQGMGQEVLNASILAFAVLMLGWHTLWMSRHGRELALAMKQAGQQVVSGERSLFALSIVVGVAILREGSETVLFLYGIAAGGETSFGEMAAGGAIGLVGGVICGILLYSGLVHIPAHRFFAVTNGLILLLAASMAAQAAGFLVQADLLPPLIDEVWNTTAFLSEKSVIGQLLHALVGYDSRPSGVQVLAYAATLALLLLGGRLIARQGTAINH
jgi:high-affinity iron transporter